MKKLQLPYGVQDFMPQECYNKSNLEEKLSKSFSLSGFRRVETSSLEYYDLFNEVVDASKINKMFKMTDNDGSLLVLRPDTTIQICRMAATKLNMKHIQKLYYVENSFEYLSDSSTARNREFAQAGVEMLGTSGLSGNVEIIRVAIEALLSAGLSDFLLEIGQVQFFDGLMAEGGINAQDAKMLRELVNSKDMLGVELFLQKKQVGDEFISKFLLLPTLFGDESVLKKAKKICANETSLRAIEEIQSVMTALKQMKLDKYVAIDLGMLQGDYYTGMILRGMSKNLGLSLLDGGRYDSLGVAFGTKMEAVGFAIGIKRLLVALENQKKLLPLPACDYAYVSDEKDCGFEWNTVQALRNKGYKVTKCFGLSESALQDYCNAEGIKKAFVLRESLKTDLMLNKQAPLSVKEKE